MLMTMVMGWTVAGMVLEGASVDREGMTPYTRDRTPSPVDPCARLGRAAAVGHAVVCALCRRYLPYRAIGRHRPRQQAPFGTTADIGTADLSDIAAAQWALNGAAPAIDCIGLPYPEHSRNPVRLRTAVEAAQRDRMGQPAQVADRDPFCAGACHLSRGASLAMTIARDGAAMGAYPERIVCLTEETTETLYLLGEGHRVVGVSGYTVRPPEARQKPKVSAFINARFDKIEALRPDVILAFSDLQADIAATLVRRGFAVFTFNQRTVAEILQMIRILGGLVGCGERAEALAGSLADGLVRIREAATQFPYRPRVFFEEWDDPLISGIEWVEELIEMAGGAGIYPELRGRRLAKERIVDPADVARRNPEVVIASWCGKALRKATITGREGWQQIAAVQHDHVYEIKSTYILQPGPASLTEGVQQLHALLARVVEADAGRAGHPVPR